ncbi:hypothetical protein MIND_00180900 [Mycena indigotica]|uniref:C2H2-type domain-containing protein n=1 Tax=Mycena indigotica TaxID=2126181 RepID=A0A8H6T9A4_9AGAR|nr:uncharacterized protein MIND_00180900 [Mycena indigotica]KAF7311710.1 hypothetical protein MIND_00180900 [Mycena indigotica]
MSSYHHHRRSEFNFWDKGALLCVRAPYVTVLTKNISVMTVYCDRCDRYFPHYGALAQHERASSAHWLCDDCEIDYTTWTGLKEHYVQSRRHFYCQHCDEHFDDGGELAEHMDDAHFYCSSRRAPLLHPLPPAVHLRKQPQRAYELGAAQATHDHVPGRGCGQSFINGPSPPPRISRRAAARRARTGSRSTATSARRDTRNVITDPRA